jgi:hypothetical protein
VLRVHQRLWSAWARRRYRDDFDDVERFCLFVGYPRSGHSLVGALLNAHREAVISHELNAHEPILAGCTRDELYARIIARAAWFAMRGNRGTYPYQVPGEWQGRFETLRVIGDKRGGLLTRALGAHPDLLERRRALVRVPLRLIHVVRNPFDNISAISLWNRLSLGESVEFYFFHCETTARLGELTDPSEVVTIRHEDMIRSPRPVLTRLGAFLDLDSDARHLDDCCSIVFDAPTYTRRKLPWSPALVRDVERRARAFEFLAGYGFEIPDDPTRGGAESGE